MAQNKWLPGKEGVYNEQNKKKYRERYKKPEVLTAVCFLLPAVFMWIYWFLYLR